jgi:hypothetical protein
MMNKELRGLLNHGVKIVPFPHEWNDFRLLSVDDDNAVFHKCSNHQRFHIPVANIVGVLPAASWERRSLVINAPVRWERDLGGYGSIWVV